MRFCLVAVSGAMFGAAAAAIANIAGLVAREGLGHGNNPANSTAQLLCYMTPVFVSVAMVLLDTALQKSPPST